MGDKSSQVRWTGWRRRGVRALSRLTHLNVENGLSIFCEIAEDEGGKTIGVMIKYPFFAMLKNNPVQPRLFIK